MNSRKIRPFLNQLKSAFVIVIMISVLLLGGFIFYSSYRYVREQRMAESANMIRQNLTDLENWTEQCELSLRYLAGNFTLQELLSMDETDYIEVNRAVRNVNQILYNAILTNPYYEGITVFTEKKFRAETALIKTPQDDMDREWYQKAMQTTDTCWWNSEGMFYIGRKIVTPYPAETVGVVVIELKQEPFENYFQMFSDVPTLIELDDKNEIVYRYNNAEDGEEWAFQEEKPLSDTGWIISYQIGESYFDQNILVNFGIPMIVILAVLAAAWVCMRFLTRYFIKDLSVLVEEVNEAQNGNLDVDIKPSSTEEIHVLSESIKRMLNRIKELIRQVYEKEIERQNLELDLLQAKISPHFLYNNLSAINWLAIDCGEEKISEITTEMATFYRTALNKGKNTDCLSVEIENIKAYVNLQLIAHEDEFDVVYDVDESLMKCIIPIFILQPLVENAIEHGIDQLENERGIIRISVKKQEACLYLTVSDNGKKLYEKIGENIMDTADYGYGTGNVHKRIQLLYGKECGLEIRADRNGTTARIKLYIKDPLNG